MFLPRSKKINYAALNSIGRTEAIMTEQDKLVPQPDERFAVTPLGPALFRGARAVNFLVLADDRKLTGINQVSKSDDGLRLTLCVRDHIFCVFPQCQD